MAPREPNDGSQAWAPVAAEHGELGALFVEARTALLGDGARAEAALERLERELAAHLELEERIYYPPLRALRPARAGTLERFTREHRRLTESIARTRRVLAEATPAEARAAFEQLADEFARHEESESELLAALDREIVGHTASHGDSHG